MNFKAITAASAAALITLSLAACASSSPAETLPDLSESRPVAVDTPNESTAPQTQPSEEVPSNASALQQLLGDIQENVTPGVAGSSLTAVPYALRLLEWGASGETGSTDDIQQEVVAYLQPLGNDVQVEFSRKLELVYEMALELLGPTGGDVFDSAGVTAVPLDSSALNQVNPVLEAVGLETKPLWKVTFEQSLYENYGYTPCRYEEISDGIYTVYVMIDDQEVPYVTVDSATGDYHG